MALRVLPLSGYTARAVLLPMEKNPNASVQGIEITVFGEYFPIRAVEPEILVGELSAGRVEVSRDQRSIRGYLFDPPPEGATIRVRYGDSQEGVLKDLFSRQRVRRLPEVCE